MTVLNSNDRREILARVVTLSGRKLIAQLPEHLPSHTCIRIDCSDAFLLGEVIGYWQDGSATCVIDLQHALTGLRELASYASESNLTAFRQPQCA